MEEEEEESQQINAENAENDEEEQQQRPDSSASFMINSEYGTPVKESSNSCTIENSLYDKYNVQQRELERLENQNAEYREKLLKTIRERDLNEELLKNVQIQHKKEIESQTKRIKDLEINLKAIMDKSTAQEAHFNVTTREMSQKYNNSVQQLTKKADQNEKEKNEAVVKYAMREGEMMKLKNEIQKTENELRRCRNELEINTKSQSSENLAQLEKCVNNLNVEVEKLKHEKFDVENRLKIAEKRVETISAGLTEAKHQCDVLRKQLIQAKDEKAQQQNVESQRREAELEKKLKEAEHDLEKLKASQLDMATKFEEASRENTDLLSKIDILQDHLSLEEDRRKFCEEQIERLKNVENFVESSSQQIEATQKEKESANEERKQAEIEAAECREYAEKMLKINQNLTERNSALQREIGKAENETQNLKNEIEEKEAKIVSMTEEIQNLCKKNDDLKAELNQKSEILKDLQQQQSKSSSESGVELKMAENQPNFEKLYEECCEKLEKAEHRLSEEMNSFSAYKKKAQSNIKELRNELSQIRRMTSSSSLESSTVLAPQSASLESAPSSRSRASSITSIDRVTSTSREEEAISEEAKRIEQQQNIQQTMIDKIVVLQRKLARRSEKIEFLEEHIRQCLEELQKKTKIIQHFALREEASLLMPSEGSLEKVPIVKKGSTYALMGAMFVKSGEKKNAQILTEVNSRLQAVLEDVIQKNINMRSTVDSLSSENAKLSRENRLLTLSQARLQDQNHQTLQSIDPAKD